MIVQAGVALGDGLELVVEVQHHLVEGHLIDQHHAILAHVFQLLLEAPPLFAELDEAAHKVGAGEDGGLDDGLFDLGDLLEGRQLGGVVDRNLRAIREVHVVAHAGGRDDEVQVKLALQTLLHDLHVEQAQKATAEAEAQGGRGLGLVGKAAVIEPQLLHGVAQVLEVVAGGGEDPGEDDGLDLLEAPQHLRGGPGVVREGVGDGVAHLHVCQLLDAGHQIAHLAHGEGIHLAHLGIEDADLVHAVFAARGHEADLVPRLQGAVHHPDEADDAPVGVVVAVEDEGLEERRRVPLGGRDALHDLLEDLLAVFPGLGAHVDRMGGIHEADDRIYLLQHPIGIGAGEVGLVEDRKDLQAVFQGQVGVGEGLSLHALGGIHHQDGALAGGQAAAHLVGKINMARGVDEVESVDLAVSGGVLQRDGVGLDGDAPLPLQVHVVQNLRLHVPMSHRFRQLEQAVRQGGLAMVDVGDDAEVANEGWIRH